VFLLLKTDVSVERITSIIRKEGIGELGTTYAAASWLVESFLSDDEGNTFLGNVGSTKNHTAPHPRRRHSTS
jgi:hypothetical protein